MLRKDCESERQFMMMRHAKPVLYDFRSISPKFQKDQQSSLEWLACAHAQSELSAKPALSAEAQFSRTQKLKKLVLRFGCSKDRIQSRNTMLDDFTHTEWDRMKIFNLNKTPQGAGSKERTLLYAEFIQDALDRLYKEEPRPPDALIHVTCTGYISPSAVQRLVSHHNWGQQTEVLHAYHMGCYASLPAIRIALGALSWKTGRADIIHTELCSLHLDPSQHSIEQLMIQSLFSDGIIRYSLADSGAFSCGKALEVLQLHEEILPNTLDAMTWMTVEHGMQMGISRDVPEYIGASLNPFLERLASKSEVSVSYLREHAIFAIHPGGPRIVDQVQTLLGLREDQVSASNQVLRTYGNMSSATLPHIWKLILQEDQMRSGQLILSLAFGPGLTISGGLMRKLSNT